MLDTTDSTLERGAFDHAHPPVRHGSGSEVVGKQRHPVRRSKVRDLALAREQCREIGEPVGLEELMGRLGDEAFGAGTVAAE